MLSLALPLLLAAAPVELAVLSKDVASSSLELRWQPLGAPRVVEPFARLEALPDETFRGVALPGSRAVAVVRTPAVKADLSFAATLAVVAPGQPERTLAANVVRASKPVLVGQRLFVERGTAGAEPRDGSFRVDSLSIDEVDPGSGRLRTVYEAKGFWVHLAGAFERELVLYVAGPEGARLEAVQVDTLAVRPLLASMPALAHDFVIDAPNQSVVFTIAEQGVERWFIERVRLGTARRERLAEGDSVALLPAVLPSGLAYAPGAGLGLRWVGRDGVALAARGAGFERVRLVAEGLVVVRHEESGEAPWVYVTRAKDLSAVPFVAPRGAIIDVAGVRR